MRSLVVIPLYNERDTLADLIGELRLHYSGDVLVVDDGSTDGSAQTLDREQLGALRIARHPGGMHLGYGASLIEGFRQAAELGYDTVVTMDCDLQHEPGLVPEFLSGPLDCDILSGSRYLSSSPHDRGAPADHLRINRLITDRLNSLTGFGITDAFCGFKAYRVEALRKLRLDESGYGLPLQLWIQAKVFGLGVREIAVPRIYLDVKRSFGQELDDPELRLRYYEGVIQRELDRWNLKS